MYPLADFRWVEETFHHFDVAYWPFSDLARRPTFVRNVSKRGNWTGRANRFAAFGSAISHYAITFWAKH